MLIITENGVEDLTDEQAKAYSAKRKYSTWDGSEWIIDLDKYKAYKIRFIKSIKDNKIKLCKVDEDKYFQADDKSLVTIESRISYLSSITDALYNNKNYMHNWRCSSNNEYQFTDRTNAIDILTDVHDLARENWGIYNELSIQILACETSEEIDEVNLNAGWVEMDIT